MRICRGGWKRKGCGRALPITAYKVTRNRKNGLDYYESICNDCLQTYMQAFRSKPEQRERTRAAARARTRTPEQRKRDRESAARAAKKRRDSNLEAFRKRERAHQLQKKYGLSLADYDRLLEKQQGCCAICGASEKDQRYGVLCVDHSHGTGRVRGLLCSRCNSGLGFALDHPHLLEAMIVYLRRAFPPLEEERMDTADAEEYAPPSVSP